MHESLPFTTDSNILRRITDNPDNRAELLQASGVPETTTHPLSGEVFANVIGIGVGTTSRGCDHVAVSLAEKPQVGELSQVFVVKGIVHKVLVRFKYYPQQGRRNGLATNADLVKLGDDKMPHHYKIADLQRLLGLGQMSGYDITGDVLSPITDTPRGLPPVLALRVGERLLSFALGKCLTLPPPL